jgi:hypothetical protein
MGDRELDGDWRGIVHGAIAMECDRIRAALAAPLQDAREALAHARERPPAVTIETLADATARLIAALEAPTAPPGATGGDVAGESERRLW